MQAGGVVPGLRCLKVPSRHSDFARVRQPQNNFHHELAQASSQNHYPNPCCYHKVWLPTTMTTSANPDRTHVPTSSPRRFTSCLHLPVSSKSGRNSLPQTCVPAWELLFRNGNLRHPTEAMLNTALASSILEPYTILEEQL